LESCEDAGAAVGLISMVGEGTLSIASAAKVSRVYQQDGFQNEANNMLASLAAGGKYASNGERDMHRWLKGLYNNGLEMDHLHLATRA